jgi:hypothetical protein
MTAALIFYVNSVLDRFCCGYFSVPVIPSPGRAIFLTVCNIAFLIWTFSYVLCFARFFAQDFGQQRTVVNIAMKIQVEKMAENFLISFSKNIFHK